MSDFMREITDSMYDFLKESVHTSLLIFRVVIIIVLAAFILLFALCLLLGWLEDWRVSLVSIPLLGCAITAFDRALGDD